MNLEMAIYNERIIQHQLDEIMMDESASEEDIDKKIDELVKSNCATIDSLLTTIPFIEHVEDFIIRCTKEKARINARQKWAVNIKEKFKDAVASYLSAKDMRKLEVGTYKIGLRSSKRTVITDKNIVPYKYLVMDLKLPGDVLQEIAINLPADLRKQFLDSVMITNPNLLEIREAIDDGFDVPGAELQNNDNLQIN